MARLYNPNWAITAIKIAYRFRLLQIINTLAGRLCCVTFRARSKTIKLLAVGTIRQPDTRSTKIALTIH
jgi:hypothetical protein